MLRFGRVVFGFRQLKQGTRTRREQEKLAEENSPVECFRRRGNERSEAIGAAAPDESPLQRAKYEAHPLGCASYFYHKLTESEHDTVF